MSRKGVAFDVLTVLDFGLVKRWDAQEIEAGGAALAALTEAGRTAEGQIVGTPPELERLTLQCLSKQPDERPGSAFAEPWTRARGALVAGAWHGPELAGCLKPRAAHWLSVRRTD